ncbi:unnamed protein product [Adineta steineri]|uniref:Uncharacterized protein n=1 Tax=Adineta steineri TaxID=433720 RepID=A0A819KMY0_9BILA|nr:unnamed protein product [Adineta steineri]CAF3951737.1 unnamed protein product [Adineta steineri]
MLKKTYLLNIIFLCFVCYAQSQSSSLSASGSFTTITSTTMTETNKILTSSILSVPSDAIQSSTINSNNITSSMTSTYASSLVTTMSIETNISVTYIYIIQSNYSLQLGIINNTNIKTNVSYFVENSFNLSNFDIIVTNIQILSKTKTISYVNQYYMLVNILFTSTRNDCNITCIYNSQVTQANNFSLPSTNGSMVDVYSDSGPLSETVLDTTTGIVLDTTTVQISTDKSTLGLSAKLGIGLGISIIGVLIIIEIIYLSWKYGLSGRSRREQYGLSSTE